MENINNYIIEKLKININSKVNWVNYVKDIQSLTREVFAKFDKKVLKKSTLAQKKKALEEMYSITELQDIYNDYKKYKITIEELYNFLYRRFEFITINGNGKIPTIIQNICVDENNSINKSLVEAICEYFIQLQDYYIKYIEEIQQIREKYIKDFAKI